MQMTSRGEGGCVTGRSPVYFFHSESTPSSPLLSLSVTAGVGNVKGRTKTSLLSSLGLWPHRTPPHLPPPPPKKSRANQTGPAGMKPEAEHTPIDSTILQHPPKTLKCVIVPSRISCKTKTECIWLSPFLMATIRLTLLTSCSLHTCICKYQKIIQNPDAVFSPPCERACKCSWR